MMRKLTSLGLIAAAAILCYGMQTSKPHYAELTGPIPVYGRPGELVTTRTFDVRVDKVTFARRLAFDLFGQHKLLTTGGVWAVVTVDLAARDITAGIGSAIWQGPGGLRYDTTERLLLVAGMPPVTAEPGLPGKGRFVFEIRPDEVSDATLLVSQARYFALDSQARIALGPVATDPDGLPQGTVETLDLAQDL